MRKYLVLPKDHRIYRGRYCLDGELKLKDVSLHTSDKQVAEQRLNEIIREEERERAGIIPPRALREGAQKELTKHLKEYIADLKARGRDELYICHLEKRIEKLLDECKWQFARDITANSFQTWRSQQEKAAKTLNEYLAGVSSFLVWMERNGRLLSNPLKIVGKVETRGKEERIRRAFTDDEVSRLLLVAGERKVVYLTALFTGLRRGELLALQWGDVIFEGKHPFIKVRASTTKNHRAALIPLREELVLELQKIRPQNFSQGGQVFYKLMPKMKTFRSDLMKAKIPFIDEQGRRADFHALRYTLATNLGKLGVPLAVAMQVMRHSDPNLTTKTYTDASQLPMQGAIDLLPNYGPKMAASVGQVGCPGSLIGSPRRGILGSNETSAVTVHENGKPEKKAFFRGENENLSRLDIHGQDGKKVGPVGFEPTTKGL
jgi:integrase